MSIDRRTALKGLAAGAAATVVGVGTADARKRKKAPDDAYGMLYDATLCIGCKACVVACKEANGNAPEILEHESLPGPIYDSAVDLSSDTRNIIKICRDGEKESFVKAQCMHCLDPGCVSACMLQAFQKGDHGIVTYDQSRCIGCRYCQVACPFNVPKFQWERAAPRIVKCELCRHRYADGKYAACCEVCPRAAVIFGNYHELLSEAKARVASKPDRYEPVVYGETDVGGTQVLYLTAAGFGFDKLGLPDVGDEPVPELSETIQHGIYKGFIAPVALYAVLGAVLIRNRRRGSKSEKEGA